MSSRFSVDLSVQLRCIECGHIQQFEYLPAMTMGEVVGLCERECPACFASNYTIRVVQVGEST